MNIRGWRKHHILWYATILNVWHYPVRLICRSTSVITEEVGKRLMLTQ